MSTRSAKRQHPQPIYELLYHPGIPGRGEYIRLPLEASGVAYTDIVSAEKNGYAILTAILDPSSTGDEDGNPPVFAPPALRVPGAGKNGKSLLIHQTPNILQYLGPKIGMLPDDEVDALHVNQLMLTALDMSNEVHDTHHPVAAMKYYEDQQDAAMEKAIDFRANRLPKFLSYFERTLRGNEKEGKGKYLVGGKLNYADTASPPSLSTSLTYTPPQMSLISIVDPGSSSRTDYEW